MGIEGDPDTQDESTKHGRMQQLPPESTENDKLRHCDQGTHEEEEDQSQYSNEGDSGKENHSGDEREVFPIPEKDSVFDDNSSSFIDNALALRENPDFNIIETQQKQPSHGKRLIFRRNCKSLQVLNASVILNNANDDSPRTKRANRAQSKERRKDVLHKAEKVIQYEPLRLDSRAWQALSLMTQRYKLSNDFKTKHNEINVRSYLVSYWSRYGGFYLMDKRKQQVIAAVVAEIEFSMTFEGDKNSTNVMLIHYTSEPNIALVALLVQIAFWNNEQFKYMYCSILGPDKDSIGSDCGKPGLEFKENQSYQDEMRFYKDIGIIIGKYVRGGAINFHQLDEEIRYILTNDGISLCDSKKPTLSSVQFEDTHSYFCAHSSEIKEKCKESLSKFFGSEGTEFDANVSDKILIQRMNSLLGGRVKQINPAVPSSYHVLAKEISNLGLVPYVCRNITNFGSILTDVSMVPDNITEEIQEKLNALRQDGQNKKRFDVHDTAAGCKDSSAIDGIDRCCAWLSIIEMVKNDHPDESSVMLQALKENSERYQDMYIYKKKTGSNATQSTLAEELKRLTHFQLMKVKGEDVSAGKARYLSWLEQEEIEGYYVCHLKTDIGLNTHCISLWRDGNGGGTVYDSYYGIGEFSSCAGFSNFDFVFEEVKTPTKVVDFLLVSRLKPSMKKNKKRKTYHNK